MIGRKQMYPSQTVFALQYRIVNIKVFTDTADTRVFLCMYVFSSLNECVLSPLDV